VFSPRLFSAKVCLCFIEFEDLKKEAFGLFFDFYQTNTWVEVSKQLKIIKRVYLNGTHCNVENLSYFDRFHTKSNQNIERINRLKNRHIRKAFGTKRKNEKFSCNKFLYVFLFVYMCSDFRTYFLLNKNT